MRASMVGTTKAWVTRSRARELEPGLGAEARQLHDAPPRVDRARDRRHAGDVVRRHADERGVLLGGRAELDGAEDVRDEVPVAQHRGLRRAGGAAGEEQDRDVVAVHRPLGAARGRRRARAREAPRARRSRRPRAPPSARARAASVTRCAGAICASRRVELGVGEPVVERHEGHARPGRAEERDRQGEAAHVEQRGVLRAATRAIASAAAPAAREQLRVGEALGRRSRTATRSPKPAAAISSSIMRFMAAGGSRERADGRTPAR